MTSMSRTELAINLSQHLFMVLIVLNYVHSVSLCRFLHNNEGVLRGQGQTCEVSLDLELPEVVSL